MPSLWLDQHIFGENLEHLSRHTAGRATKFAAYVVNNPLIWESPCEYLACNKAAILRHHRTHCHYTLLSRPFASRDEIIAAMLEFNHNMLRATATQT